MRKLVIWGNCQTAGIFYVLQRLPAVTSRWDVKHHELWAADDVLERNLKDFDDCDVLLLQDLSNWKNHPRRDSLNPATRVVRFPFCYFAALWPFDGHQNGPDLAWHYGEGEAQFGFQDHLLGRLRTMEPDPERRFDRYRSLDVEGLPDIARYASFEEARLRRTDKRLESSLGGMIIDNYRTIPMFHAITHPTGIVMTALLRELLGKLDLHDPNLENYNHDYLRYCQVPVHPLVIERLGLTWANEQTRYNFHDREELTFEEHTRRYIRVYG